MPEARLRPIDLLGRGQIQDLIWLERAERYLAASTRGLWSIDPLSGTESAWMAQPQAGGISALDLSDDGKLLVSASTDCLIQLWDVATQTVRLALNRVNTDRLVNAVQFSPDGRFIIAQTTDGLGFGEMRVWEVETGTLRSTVKSVSGFGALAFNPDSQKAYYAQGDSTVVEVDLSAANSAPRAFVKAHQIALFAGDSGNLWGVDAGGGIETWDIHTGVYLSSWQTAQTSTRVAAVEFSPDGQLLALSWSEPKVQVWNIASQSPVFTLNENFISPPTLKFLTDTQLAIFAPDSVVDIWDVIAGTRLMQINWFTGHTARVTDLAVQPGTCRLASASEDGSVRLWDSANLQELLKWSPTFIAEQLEFSPDGSLLATIGRDARIELWDATDGTLLQEDRQHSDFVTDIAFSRDGHFLASVGLDGRAVFRDRRTSAIQSITLEQGQDAFGIAFAADESLIIIGYVNVWLWTPADGQVTLLVENDASLSAWAINAAADRLALGTVSGQVQVWDLNTRQIVNRLLYPAPVNTVALSDDGRQLFVSAGLPGERAVNQLTNLVEASSTEFSTLLEAALKAMFVGHLFAAGSRSNQLLVAERTTGQEDTLDSWQQGGITALATSCDQVRLFSGGGDGTLRAWSLGSD